MGKLYTNIPTYITGKRNLKLGSKISTKMLNSIDQYIYLPPFLDRWDKIATLNKQNQPQMDWGGLQAAAKKASHTT